MKNFLSKRTVLILVLLLGCFCFKSCSSPPFKRKVFRIARDTTWYPLDFMGKDNNMLGFTDDVIFAAAKEKNLQVDLIFTTSNLLINGVSSDLYDGAVTSITPTSSTRSDFDFSDPLILLGAVLVVHKTSDIHKLKQLEEKVIGIHRGSAAAFDTVRFPSVTITPYENNMLALEDLSQKSIDGVIMQVTPAFIYMDSFFKESIKIATQPLTDLGLRIISKRNRENEKFLSEFNEGLEMIKEKGIYDELIKKWALFNPESVRDKLEIKLEVQN